jgi:lipoprotein-anchoring transpeptidase ErfK/SrfK
VLGIENLTSLAYFDPNAASPDLLASTDGRATAANPEGLPTSTLAVIDSSAATETPMQPVAPTPTFTNTPTPTDTPTPTATFTPTPTATYTPPPPPPTEAPLNPAVQPPRSVSGNEHWIDIDLSEQYLYAYEGDQMVRSFRVSTGTWRTPTVLGRYRIYVKYRSQAMSGPGYYLPNVPFVMYFFKGYGIHGTYWHNNFGTPMSHGCVNMRTEEAAWLYKWSSIGTLVNVHR